MKQTYKTDHPTIKEISIGDKFVTESGEIVEFHRYDDYIFNSIPFFIGKLWYNKELKCRPFDIKHKYFPLKDKINLL